LSVRALADNTERELLPGQFVKVELILQTTIDALMVPSEAVVPELNGHKVFLARKGKAEEVKVTIGLRTEREVEIVSGLNPKDTLITTGILQLRQGMGIQITEIHN
jgi:membrane fusion protein (multidrug efflux system)